MSFNIRDLDIRKVNTLTKYPSILTYHEMGEKGRLNPTTTMTFNDPLVVTEKIDGTNSRLCIFPSIYVIGSREELLYGEGDLIVNPTLGIVEVVRSYADRGLIRVSDAILLVYGEVYGNTMLNAWKQYSASGKNPAFRVFDAVKYELGAFLKRLEDPIEKISAWREGAGEIPFVGEEELGQIATALHTTVTPRIPSPGPLPTGLAETHEWLKRALPGKSHAMLDETAKGQPEGVVVRTPDRKKVVKLRFEDYERTLRSK